jgi:hypothetical protein
LSFVSVCIAASKYSLTLIGEYRKMNLAGIDLVAKLIYYILNSRIAKWNACEGDQTLVCGKAEQRYGDLNLERRLLASNNLLLYSIMWLSIQII